MSGIKNHQAGRMSELEERMSVHIPPGGNWESIPEEIPSERLAQIRRMSAERGKCRTTYYGRLSPVKPSYTVNTWFSKLGNGTFLHYDMSQDRLITQREAARLQSFPDCIEFLGSFSSRFRQIGNAVPPFLFYSLLRHGLRGGSVADLFCGAGGLSVACEWAGIDVACGVDNDRNAMITFRSLHPRTRSVEGDLRDPDVRASVVEASQGVEIIVGGPPCQGFSQAGWYQAGDSRNNLFREFLDVVQRVRPRSFVMENVQGLVWMDKGRAIATIVDAFAQSGYRTHHFVLSAERYGVPQVRKRVFIVGTRDGEPMGAPPMLCSAETDLFSWPVVSCADALSDLPAIVDGAPAATDYISPPVNPYQAFMRSQLSACGYFDLLIERKKWRNAG